MCSNIKSLLNQEYVHVTLYAVSILALLPAIVIFFSYKYASVISNLHLEKGPFPSNSAADFGGKTRGLILATTGFKTTSPLSLKKNLIYKSKKIT